jgi:hypothetical protein
VRGLVPSWRIKAILADNLQKPRYAWPWFVLGAVLLGIVLAVAWMSREVERTRRVRELGTPAPQTNGATQNSLRR